MGMFASVRGWVELMHDQRAAAEQVIQRNRHGDALDRTCFDRGRLSWLSVLWLPSFRRCCWRTNATLPRLSHVAQRLEDRDLVQRFPCPQERPGYQHPAHGHRP